MVYKKTVNGKTIELTCQMKKSTDGKPFVTMLVKVDNDSLEIGEIIDHEGNINDKMIKMEAIVYIEGESLKKLKELLALNPELQRVGIKIEDYEFINSIFFWRYVIRKEKNISKKINNRIDSYRR